MNRLKAFSVASRILQTMEIKKMSAISALLLLLAVAALPHGTFAAANMKSLNGSGTGVINCGPFGISIQSQGVGIQFQASQSQQTVQGIVTGGDNFGMSIFDGQISNGQYRLEGLVFWLCQPGEFPAILTGLCGPNVTIFFFTTTHQGKPFTEDTLTEATGTLTGSVNCV